MYTYISFVYVSLMSSLQFDSSVRLYILSRHITAVYMLLNGPIFRLNGASIICSLSSLTQHRFSVPLANIISLF